MTSWVINRKGMKTSQSQPDKRGKGANRIYRGESQQEAEGAGGITIHKGTRRRTMAAETREGETINKGGSIT